MVDCNTVLNIIILSHIQCKPNPFGTEAFVQFRQVFGKGSNYIDI